VTLTVIIPVYNEEATIATVIERVLALRQPNGPVGEIIVVDDASTDGTSAILSPFVEQGLIRLVRHPRNRGKGAAIRNGIAAATGTYTIFQDADLEYEPADIPMLWCKALEGAAVVYGSRFVTGNTGATSFHAIANRFLSFLARCMTGMPITDMETCYKLVRTDVLKRLNLREERFGIEPEITVKIALLGCHEELRYAEVPITYRPRGYSEGKKIGFGDGVKAIYCLIRYRIEGLVSRSSYLKDTTLQ